MTYVAAVLGLSALQEPGDGHHNHNQPSNILSVLHSHASHAQVQTAQISIVPAWKPLYCPS